MNRVIPKLAGRLGNHLFMVANAYRIARTNNLPLVLSFTYFDKKEFYIDSIFRKLPFTYDVSPLDITPAGYYQSINYFKDFETDIRDLFAPDDIFYKEVLPLYNHIDFSNTCCVSVRRGDYLRLSDYHPVVSEQYLRTCMKLSKMKNFLFFSDDNEWCKNTFKGDNIYYCEDVPHSVRKMWLMSQCKEHIISNSSYSWWGAFLSSTPKGTVYAPSTWYGPRANKSTWAEIYVPHWTIVDTTYKDGQIIPI